MGVGDGTPGRKSRGHGRLVGPVAPVVGRGGINGLLRGGVIVDVAMLFGGDEKILLLVGVSRWWQEFNGWERRRATRWVKKRRVGGQIILAASTMGEWWVIIGRIGEWRGE